MKSLIVGDPHVMPKNLNECEKLMAFIVKSAISNKVDQIVLMGDLNHFHSVLRVEVQNFWLKWLKILSSDFKVIAIRGNHDQSSHQTNSQSSLLVFSDLSPDLTIVEDLYVNGDSAYVPYLHSESDFKSVLDRIPDSVSKLWIHQTVDGSKYEGGFYAPDGFSLDPLKKFDQVISGHVHSTQDIGNVWYCGTPKWDTKSDANQNKGIWIFDHESLSRVFISTEDVVTPIRHLIWKEEDDAPKELKTIKGTVYLELVGAGAWISKTSKKYKDSFKIVPKPTDSVLKSMEKKQLIKSFDDFLAINVPDEEQRKAISNFVETV